MLMQNAAVYILTGERKSERITVNFLSIRFYFSCFGFFSIDLTQLQHSGLFFVFVFHTENVSHLYI